MGVQACLAPEPSLTDADTVYAGVEDAASSNQLTAAKAGRNCRGCGRPKAISGNQAPAVCVSIRFCSTPQRQPHLCCHLGGQAFRTDDGGETWLPINKGLVSPWELPDTKADVDCVHNLALHPSQPDVVFMQKHWDVMRTDNAGDLWHEISGNLPSDFGFPIAVHAHEPETVYVIPIKSDSEHFPPEEPSCALPQPEWGQ
ncbi:MAG: hypothetical protein R3E79_16695 [Caldilineaceae bacterium]